MVLSGPRTAPALNAVTGGAGCANWPLPPGSISVARSRLSHKVHGLHDLIKSRNFWGKKKGGNRAWVSN